MLVKPGSSRAAAFARYTRVPPREFGQSTSDFLFRGACCSYGVDRAANEKREPRRADDAARECGTEDANRRWLQRIDIVVLTSIERSETSQRPLSSLATRNSLPPLWPLATNQCNECPSEKKRSSCH